MTGTVRRHRAHRCALQLATRHDGNGSPQLSQIGGVMGRTALQQA
jgi:hypothetical protein